MDGSYTSMCSFWGDMDVGDCLLESNSSISCWNRSLVGFESQSISFKTGSIRGGMSFKKDSWDCEGYLFRAGYLDWNVVILSLDCSNISYDYGHIDLI